MNLHPIVQDKLDSCPSAGGGIHEWVYDAARNLHYHFPDKEAMADLIASKCANRGRVVPRREIMDAIRRSESTAWHPDGKALPTSRYSPLPKQEGKKWPDVNEALVRQVLTNNVGLIDLANLSPVPAEAKLSRTDYFIDALFPGNSLLCVGWSNSEFMTRSRESLRGKLVGMQLIVPSPMSKEWGVTKDGKKSQHCLDNTGPRRFLITEFDQGTIDEHASKIYHLSQFAPLVMAVHSGGKSLHGWFYVAGKPEETVLKFMRYAVGIGADKATDSRCQFVRMPDGLRANKDGTRVRQRTIFFNPKAMEVTQ